MAIAVLISIYKAVVEPFFKPFIKKYLHQPKLFIVLKKGKGTRTPLIKSQSNPVVVRVKQIDMNSIQLCTITTRFSMTIRNNSEHTAYNLRLLMPDINSEVSLDKSIDPYKPLMVNGSEEFTFIVTKIFEGTGVESYSLHERGLDFFNRSQILLEYTNVKHTKFYTLFDYSADEFERNKYYKKLPQLSDMRLISE